MEQEKAYPGAHDTERSRMAAPNDEEQPDWVGGAPNYEKFKGWTPEQVLAWLNID